MGAFIISVETRTTSRPIHDKLGAASLMQSATREWNRRLKCVQSSQRILSTFNKSPSSSVHALTSSRLSPDPVACMFIAKTSDRLGNVLL